MECPNCGHGTGISKNLRPGEERTRDECPECGSDLDKARGGNRSLINK